MNPSAQSPTPRPQGAELKWTLARKIGGLCAVLLALLVALFAVAYEGLSTIGSGTRRLTQVDLPTIEVLGVLQQLQMQQDLVVAFAEQALLATGENAAQLRREGRELLDTVAREFDEEVARFGELATKEGQHGDGLTEAAREAARDVAEIAERGHELVRRLGQAFTVLEASQALAPAELEWAEGEAHQLDQLLEERMRALALECDDASEALEAVEAGLLRTLGGLLLAALVFGTLASWWLVRGVTRVARGVQARAREIASGNLALELLHVETSDEIGQIAGAFNEMQTSLRDQIVQILSAVQNLEATATEVLASVSQQSAATREQATAIHEITATMEEISQSGVQMAERAQQVAATSDQSKRAADSGLTAVSEGNQTIESIRQQVEDVAEHIVNLSEKTQTVGEIIAAVNDIAEQSNLLALNAAIEAASSGEQGSRFSVVAGEIKNLADHAKDSTSQVRKILGEIQKGINMAVMLTEEAVKRSESGRRQSEITDRAIRELAEATRGGMNAFEQVIAGTSQQRIGLDQVSQGMQDMRAAAEQTVSSTTQLERAVASVNAMSKQLRGTVERYRL